MQRLQLGARQRAFTLIEVLVVVFIIGVILGFASLSLGGRSLDDQLDQEARRLQQVLQIASEDAIFTTTEIGLQLLPDGYVFVVPGEPNWVPIERQRSPLRAHRFEIPARLTISQASLGNLGQSPDDGEQLPAILFLSSGEVTPFELELGAPGADSVFRIQGRIDGLIQMRRERAET